MILRTGSAACKKAGLTGSKRKEMVWYIRMYSLLAKYQGAKILAGTLTSLEKAHLLYCTLSLPGQAAWQASPPATNQLIEAAVNSGLHACGLSRQLNRLCFFQGLNH
ncbi:hypothetical protein TWF718_004493 [Orbilia javanica]|uniref:Uncharacterized protein n=1 Tax=Orbilia javanica TaxID=47235 RepID=A0AAN8MXV8_9PEZI